MNNNYAPCFNRIDFVVIPSHIELPCSYFVLPLDKSIVLIFFSLTAALNKQQKNDIMYWVRQYDNGMLIKGVFRNLSNIYGGA